MYGGCERHGTNIYFTVWSDQWRLKDGPGHAVWRKVRSPVFLISHSINGRVSNKCIKSSIGILFETRPFIALSSRPAEIPPPIPEFLFHHPKLTSTTLQLLCAPQIPPPIPEFLFHNPKVTCKNLQLLSAFRVEAKPEHRSPNYLLQLFS